MKIKMVGYLSLLLENIFQQNKKAFYEITRPNVSTAK